MHRIIVEVAKAIGIPPGANPNAQDCARLPFPGRVHAIADL
jgi:hypothetical protein